jgi:hypothetical protein
MLTGQITVRTGTAGKDLLETVLHEGLHRFWVPIGGTVAKLRAYAQLWVYHRSEFFRYVMEAASETLGTASLRAGLMFPIKEGYVTNLGRLMAEGLGYLAIVTARWTRLFDPAPLPLTPNSTNAAQPAPSP